jgi:predicted metal-dependent hydrolase
MSESRPTGHDLEQGRPRDGEPPRTGDRTRGRNRGGGRDRDAAGRARNARPRDGLGRPLPYGAEGVARQPEEVRRPPGETLAEAQRLLDEGMPFHAHEVLEDAWKSTDVPGERTLWRGMAQLAVGLTHAARGNTRGAVALLRRGAEVIAPYQEHPPYDIDAGRLAQWARQAADDLESGSHAAGVPLTPPRLRDT